MDRIRMVHQLHRWFRSLIVLAGPDSAAQWLSNRVNQYHGFHAQV